MRRNIGVSETQKDRKEHKRMNKMRIAALILALTAMCACSACAQTYAYGDRADAVALIQEALTELGFYYADVTGHYGRKTERAVLLFQRRHRLAQTGSCDARTFEMILSEADMDIPEHDEEQAPLSGTMRQGDRGSAVRLLQESLTELGFYKGTITGSFGGLTKEAVRLFQRAHDLSSDGIAGPRTLAKIADEMGKEQDDDEEDAWIEEEDDGEIDVPSVLLADISALNTEVRLRVGSRSGYVRRLQNALIALGYFDGKADSIFGSQTENAVRVYQTARGLTIDGIAGRATLKKINEDIRNGVTAQEAPID